MAQAQNTMAAELHEAAAKSHRIAANLHGKKNDTVALEHCSKAMLLSERAHKSSMAAHGMSAAVEGRK